MVAADDIGIYVSHTWNSVVEVPGGFVWVSVYCSICGRGGAVVFVISLHRDIRVNVDLSRNTCISSVAFTLAGDDCDRR